MLRLTHPPFTLISAALFVVASCQLSAFEQGTYFIFQLVEQAEDKPAIAQRLTLDSKLFTEAKKSATASTPSIEQSSEFEMDYTSFGTEKATGFNSSFSTTGSSAYVAHRAIAPARRAIFAAVIYDLQVQGIPTLLRKEPFQIALSLYHAPTIG